MVGGKWSPFDSLSNIGTLQTMFRPNYPLEEHSKILVLVLVGGSAHVCYFL